MGRGSDIWSLGCIFVEVLAANLGTVVDLRKQMATKNNGYFFEPGHSLLGKSTSKLNKAVKAWLNNDIPLESPSRAALLQACRSIIKKMMQIEREHRITSVILLRELDKLGTDQNTADTYSSSQSRPGDRYTSVIVQDIGTHQELTLGTPTSMIDQVTESTPLLTCQKDLIIRDSAWLRTRKIYTAILQFFGREEPLVEGKTRVRWTCVCLLVLFCMKSGLIERNSVVVKDSTTTTQTPLMQLGHISPLCRWMHVQMRIWQGYP